MTRLVVRTCGNFRISRYRCVGPLADKPTRFSAGQLGNLEGCVEEMQSIISGLFFSPAGMSYVHCALLGGLNRG